MNNFYADSEECSKLETIEKYIYLLEIYKEKPTLEEALLDLFENANLSKADAKEIYNHLYAVCKHTIDNNFEKIKAENPKITREEALIISSYTYEPKTKYKKYSPYTLLNKNMVESNRKEGIKNVDKYLLIFVLALRKIKRCEVNALYRCIPPNVKYDEDTNGVKYDYKEGNIKRFWSFTSTSKEKSIAESFLNKEKNGWGTRFILKGDNMWGYDITLFNVCNEQEIILMPERDYEIENIREGNVTEITCNLLKKTGDILLYIRECPNCGSLDNEKAYEERLKNIRKKISEIAEKTEKLVDKANNQKELEEYESYANTLIEIQNKLIVYNYKKKCHKCNKEY
jgi:hypothetical protein